MTAKYLDLKSTDVLTGKVSDFRVCAACLASLTSGIECDEHGGDDDDEGGFR